MGESSTSRIGIDLGGTKIAAVALDAAGRVLFERRVPTPADYRGCLEAIGSLVAAADEATGVAGTVGIGIPGAISPASGRVKNANSTWLTGHPMDRDLAEVLGRPVRVMNDANCFALSEATDGAGAGASVVFGVILGTGVGGGIVVNGTLLAGAQRIAGEWGHNPLPWARDDERPGPACYCGQSGCIETFLSGPGLAADYLGATGQARSSEEIAEAALAGDAGAADALARYVDRLGRALAVVVNVLDPDVIVLGGGVSGLPDLAARAEAALAGRVFSDEIVTEIRLNRHGPASGVRGAAWLWPRVGNGFDRSQ